MFDIAWSELILIAVVALVVIGPKDLPRVLRNAGRWSRRLRTMAGEFQRHIDDMIRESELEDLRKQAEKAAAENNLMRPIEQAAEGTGTAAPPRVSEADAAADLPRLAADGAPAAASPTPPPASAPAPSAPAAAPDPNPPREPAQ